MKIVWISHSGQPSGGAELTMLEAARGLIERGVEIHAVLPERLGLDERLKELGVSVSVLPFVWWVGRGRWRAMSYRLKRAGTNLWQVPRLARHIRKVAPEVVVSNTLAVPTGAIAARLAGVPHVWYAHELFGLEGHDLFFDWGDRTSLALMNRLSAKVIVNSQSVYKKLIPSIPGGKLRLVQSAVEVPAQPPSVARNGGGMTLIQSGLLSPGKRQEDAVRAVAHLVHEGLDLKLKLLGNEAEGYEHYLSKLCRELNIQERVVFIPFTTDPFPHIVSADVVLMCSRGEAFGRVTIEAMKLGKPVIGADSAGTAELISDGRTGFLFRPGNVEDLSAKIRLLYGDPALMRQVGERARKWATDTFSREKYASALVEVFQEVTRQ